MPAIPQIHGLKYTGSNFSEGMTTSSTPESLNNMVHSWVKDKGFILLLRNNLLQNHSHVKNNLGMNVAGFVKDLKLKN